MMSVKKQDVATHVLGVMVRGIFTDLNFPYAHFPTTILLQMYYSHLLGKL